MWKFLKKLRINAMPFNYFTNHNNFLGNFALNKFAVTQKVVLNLVKGMDM